MTPDLFLADANTRSSDARTESTVASTGVGNIYAQGLGGIERRFFRVHIPLPRGESQRFGNFFISLLRFFDSSVRQYGQVWPARHLISSASPYGSDVAPAILSIRPHLLVANGSPVESHLRRFGRRPPPVKPGEKKRPCARLAPGENLNRALFWRTALGREIDSLVDTADLRAPIAGHWEINESLSIQTSRVEFLSSSGPASHLQYSSTLN